MKFSLRTLLIAGMLGPPVLALLYAAWCWDPKAPKLAPVTGVVSLNGQPVTGAIIYFTLDDGNSAIGITDQSGEYQLSYMGRIGCPGGLANVWIDIKNRRTPGGVTIPARYTDLRQTPLTAYPKFGETNRIDFQLTSP